VPYYFDEIVPAVLARLNGESDRHAAASREPEGGSRDGNSR
jgi:hypothetical protein